jgi:hypothetical protein
MAFKFIYSIARGCTSPYEILYKTILIIKDHTDNKDLVTGFKILK